MVLKTFNFSNAIMAWWSRLTPHILHIWSPYSPTMGREGGKKDENNVGVSSPSSRRAAGKTWQGLCHDKMDSRIRQQSGEYGQTSQAARKIPGISSIFPSNCSEMLRLCRQISTWSRFELMLSPAGTSNTMSVCLATCGQLCTRDNWDRPADVRRRGTSLCSEATASALTHTC